jgi:biotin carboxyl carrier protein
MSVATTLPQGADLGSRSAEEHAQSMAAILELMVRVVQSPSLARGCLELAGGLRDYLGCERVALALRAGEQGPCSVAAVSGLAEFDRRSAASQALELLLNEALACPAPLAWAAGEPLPAWLPGVRKTAEVLGTPGLVCGPLKLADGRVIGSWAFLGSAEFARADSARGLIEAGTEPLAASLEALLGATASPWRRATLRATAAMRSRRGTWVCGIVLAVLALLSLPVPYQVSCQCRIEPQVRRFVAAPYAGIFEKSLVEPGDVVRRGQVLGRMDAREIRWEIAGLEADEQRAGKSRDANLANSKVAAAAIDRLEMERFELKRRLLAERAEHLEIKSPIDGVVIAGDLKRSEGVTLKLGQSLYEIAPLEAMVAELAIPEAEIAQVAPGQEVTFWLDAYPGQAWTGKLARLQPRSEVRDSENVFVGELVLDNADALLRPGMNGEAKIRGPRHTLFWIVLHKPWNWLLDRF